MNVDGSDVRRVSNGEGRTTCGYFYDGGRRILYSSTFEDSRECPPTPDRSQGYVWPLEQPGDLHRAAGRVRSPATHAERRLRRRGHRVARREADRVHQHARRRHRALHHEDRRQRRPPGNPPRWATTAAPSSRRTGSSWSGARCIPRPPPTPPTTSRLLGQRLVRPTRLEIWVADADGSNARQITHLGAASFAPFFHPDGRRIVFASNYPDARSRNFDLYLVGTRRQRARAGDHEPGVRRLPDVQPRRARSWYSPPTGTEASAGRRTSSSRTGWSSGRASVRGSGRRAPETGPASRGLRRRRPCAPSRPTPRRW